MSDGECMHAYLRTLTQLQKCLCLCRVIMSMRKNACVCASMHDGKLRAKMHNCIREHACAYFCAQHHSCIHYNIEVYMHIHPCKKKPLCSVFYAWFTNLFCTDSKHSSVLSESIEWSQPCVICVYMCKNNVYACMYACMLVCMLCLYACMYACMYSCVYVCNVPMCICMYVYTHTQTYVCDSP